MKRTLSILVVLVMLVSMFSFMTTGVSANVLKSTYEDAKDGDLLYEVKFGQSTGAYQPKIFRALETDNVDGAVVVSDDGRTLSFTKTDATGAQMWYGGEIAGLTWGGDKVYTMTMEVMLPAKRGGVHFNFPTAAKQEELKGTGTTDNNWASVMYGIYGRFDPSGDLGTMKTGSRIAGRFRCDTAGYKEFEPIIVEEGTFLNVTYLIEGYSYALFINGVFCEVVDLAEADVKDVSDNLGFSVYLYWATTLSVKNVNVYKGDTVSAKATYPSYAKSYEHYVEADTTTAEPTTPEETTKAPDTTPTPAVTTKAPAATTKAPAATTEAPKSEGGCGSAVASGLALIALVSLAGVVVAKKQK